MPIATVKKLNLHLDDRGYLYEMLRKDDPFYKGFGQAYVSSINPGVVKGFHKHSMQTDHVVCVVGQIKLVLIRDLGPRPSGGTMADVEEHHLSVLSPQMVVIPPDIYHGWMCVGNEPALVINFSTHPFDPQTPDEERVDPHDNPWGYVWGIKDA